MSRGNQQAIILLSVVAGCLGTLLSRNCFARTDIKKRIHDTFDQTCLTINQWPFDSTDSLDPAIEKIHAWDRELGTKDIPANVLIYMIGRVLYDLEERLKNAWKVERVKILRKMFQPIEDFADTERANFIAYDEGEKAMKYLDKLLEE